MNLDDIFLQSFLKDYTQREKQKIIHSQEDRAIAAQKKKKLEIIEEFLQKFVDLEVSVTNRDQHTKNASGFEGLEPQKFKFYLVDSSKTWSPGISIFFDHPCEVEIAIPNKTEEEGVVVIKVASHHPDSYILEQKFYNFESACKALARFLSKNTVKIGKDPRKYVRENLNKKPPTDFLQNIPENPPTQSNRNTQTKENKENIEHNSLSLKKIGEFFTLSKNKDSQDE